MYSSRLRVRACGIIVNDGRLLLLKHNTPTRPYPIWLPPGGGVLYGETVERALVREAREETGLNVRPTRLLWVHEFIEEPHHAIEFYFDCSVTGGELQRGTDPEHKKDEQIILDATFVPFAEAAQLDLYPPFLKTCCKKGGQLPQNIRHITAGQA